MKRLLSLLLLLPLILGGCDDDESRTETWTVASEKGAAGIAMNFGYVPAYIVKTAPHADWETFSGTIEGFMHEHGYESVLRVRIDKIVNPPADGPDSRYTMEQLIAHTPAQPAVDPLRFSPEFEVAIASERGDNQMTAYWFKDMRYPDPRWQPFPWEIEGFDFKPGFESRLLVQPVAEYDDTAADYTVKYYQTKLITSEEKTSEGLPGKGK